MARKEDDVRKETEVARLAELRGFSKLVTDYWSADKQSRDGVKEQIERAIAGKGGKKEQDNFLWETIRQKIIDSSVAAIALLNTREAKDLYLIGEESVGVEEYARRVLENPEKYKAIYSLIHQVKDSFSNIALDAPEANYSFPYNHLNKADNPYLASVSANLGHDITNVSGFRYPVYQLYDIAEYLKFRRELETRRDISNHEKIVIGQLPFLLPGIIWLFESFKQMGENKFPQQEGADFSKVAEVVFREAIIRAYQHTLLTFNYQDKSFVIASGNLRKPGKWCQDSFSLKAKIEPGMVLTGNEAGLHLVLYQLVKNSVALLQIPAHKVKEAEVNIVAKECQIKGTKMIAFRICDNGPGIDIARILRAKQRLLQEKGLLTPKEQMIIGDWACLDLRVREVIDFIFERRVSGAEREGPHSGIGLALAKEIVDRHGGCIWATNLSGKEGAKFLVLLNPSGEGQLRQNLPELFDLNSVPADILGNIDRHLDKYSTPAAS